MFKRKQKRSEWLDSLILTENLIQQGYTSLQNNTLVSADGNSISINLHPERVQGCSDYLNHYENNLK